MMMNLYLGLDIRGMEEHISIMDITLLNSTDNCGKN